MLSSDVNTKSGLAVDVDILVGRVAGGDSQALSPGRSISVQFGVAGDLISLRTRETRQFNTESCLQVYQPWVSASWKPLQGWGEHKNDGEAMRINGT